MSRSFQIFLPERPDVGPLLADLGWQRKDGENADFGGFDHFYAEGREWFADIWGPSPMSWEDAPPEAVALQAGIAWHVEVSLEGSDAGLRKVTRAVQAVAKAGAGVVADEDNVWRPGSRRRTRWSAPSEPMSNESEFLKMIWWTAESTLASPEGTQALVETLNRVIPEAIPVRWGDFEPLPLSLETEGLDGLARFIERHQDGLVHTKVRAPFYEFLIADVYGPRKREEPGLRLSPAGTWEVKPRAATPTMGRSLTIEVAGSILKQPGWGRQLSVAFRRLSLVVRPFYAEARIETDVPWGYGQVHLDGSPVKGSPRYRSRTHVPPVHSMNWWGFPRVAPLAMVVGPPYTAHWHHPGGIGLEDLIVYSSESWPDPAPGGVPVASEDLLQGFDPRRVDPRHKDKTSPIPTRTPATWPFPAERSQT
jgi:hypothetical protein